jgi:hypothetical protein
MGWAEAFESVGLVIASRSELVSCGARPRGLTAAVRNKHLTRVRRDHYALPGTAEDIVQAVRVGGRIACISALAHAGIFAFDASFPHIHLRKAASRSRSPRNRFVPLTVDNRDGVELHWVPLAEPERANEFSVGLRDALIQAVRCQHSWMSVASLDNALHLGLVDRGDIRFIFQQLGAKYSHLEKRLNGRSESGQESVLRMILDELGLDYEIQVTFPGIGRVDFLVENRLVIEADSRLAHEGWELHVRDRDRDIELARRHLMSIRPAYRRTMFAPNDVRDAILGLLTA